MISPEIFTNLGIGGGSIFIMWMMLQYFMKRLDSKDLDSKELIKDFKIHVEMCNTNFMKINEHSNKVMRLQAKAFDGLTTRLGEALGQIATRTTVEVMNDKTKVKT